MMIVCIDGPAGSGKSTISRLVAERAGFVHLDTGAIYRSIAYIANVQSIDWNDSDSLTKLAEKLDLRFESTPKGQRVLANGEDVSEQIRSPQISQGASMVSRHPELRRQLLDLQRNMAARQSLVAEGRDTGTVVFPNAELKIYLDASLKERARRRMGDFIARGETIALEQVEQDVAARDRADSEREVAPLTAAADAVILDTTNLTPEQVVENILGRIRGTRAD